MMQDMSPDAYILLFMLFVVALVGLASLVIAVYVAISLWITKPETKTNWERDWREIEEDLSR